MKILVTGFNPFGQEKINPSFEAIKNLPDYIKNSKIIKKELPTEYKKSKEVLEKIILKEKPNIILCVGQAGGRSNITVERVSINLIESKIADNVGYKPENMEVLEDGEKAYFATIPVKNIVNKIRNRGIPADISYTAGTFVCNFIMYYALYYCEKYLPKSKAGFIHVPFIPSQVANKERSYPSMSLEDITKALETAIEEIIDYDEIS